MLQLSDILSQEKVLAQFQRQFQGMQLRLASLKGQSIELRTRKTELVQGIALALARIELVPQVAEVFTYLQEKAHARAVGEFEYLLSALVADVLPEAGTIELELGTGRGTSSLDIWLRTPAGHREGILDGNGGGITNVVVTGLLYAAVARTNNRAFVVLDEPDCWVIDHRVPAYTKVIAEVSNPRVLEDGTAVAGYQTLMITHKHLDLMDPAAHVLYLTIEDGLPHIESLSGAKAWDSDEQEGIRWIECENLRRHARTRVDLSPGLNVLAGDINGGKSTLFLTALRAIAYGDSDDTLLRHETDTATVRVGLENEVVLEMSRHRKASPKVLFRRFDKGVLTHEGRQETRGTVPSFISDALRINLADGLDIQLRSQKEPIFLLNESSSRRAQILSVGREAGLLHSMMESQRLAVRRDRDQLRKDEADLSKVNLTLRALSPLGEATGVVSLLAESQQATQDALSASKVTQALVSRMEPLVKRVAVLKAADSTLKAQLSVPVIQDTATLKSLIFTRMEPLVKRVAVLTASENTLKSQLSVPVIQDTVPLKTLVVNLERSLPRSRLPSPGRVPALPLVADTGTLRALLGRLQQGSSRVRIVAQVPTSPVVPQLLESGTLSAIVAKLGKQAVTVSGLEADAKKLDLEFSAAQKEQTDLKTSLGTCPVCDQPFAGAHPHD